MKRIDKIYRDKPSAEELYEVLTCCCDERDEMDCCGDCKQCAIDYLNEEIPDTEFIEELKAIKLLFPKARKLAMDKNGKAFIYKGEVGKCDEAWVGYCRSRYVEGLNNYSSDWENSLIDIDEVLEKGVIKDEAT